MSLASRSNSTPTARASLQGLQATRARVEALLQRRRQERDALAAAPLDLEAEDSDLRRGQALAALDRAVETLERELRASESAIAEERHLVETEAAATAMGIPVADVVVRRSGAAATFQQRPGTRSSFRLGDEVRRLGSAYRWTVESIRGARPNEQLTLIAWVPDRSVKRQTDPMRIEPAPSKLAREIVEGSRLVWDEPLLCWREQPPHVQRPGDPSAGGL